MLLTLKTRINITNEQQFILTQMSNEARLLYNDFLGKLKDQYALDKKFISYYVQQKELKDRKCEYLTFDVKKEILRTLHANFTSFFNLMKHNKDLNPQPPKFRSKDYFFTLSFTQDFLIKDKDLKISYFGYKKLNVKLDWVEPIKGTSCLRNKTADSDIKQLKVYKRGSNYFASVVYEKKVESQKLINQTEVLSIDLGKKNLLAVYDVANNVGTVYSSKHMSANQKFLDKRIDELKGKRDTKIAGSIKHKKVVKKLNAIQSKKKTQTALTLQKVSTDLSKSNKTIVLGDLTNLKNNIKTPFRKLNRQMQNNWSLQTFIHLLEYKTLLRGNQVIKVNEAWTSKTCCKCGNINHDLDLTHRHYICECGNSLNRDLNGAINIYKVFIDKFNKQNMGDYNPPLETIKVLERFDWCHVNQMNRRNIA